VCVCVCVCVCVRLRCVVSLLAHRLRLRYEDVHATVVPTFLPAPSMESYLPWKVVCTPHPRTHSFSHLRSPHQRQGKIGLSLGHIVMRGAAFAGRV
jgi:hypothetical protein